MEIYRYFWTKVTDHAGRVASSKAGLEVIECFERGEIPPSGEGGRATKDLPAQARQYLAPQQGGGRIVVSKFTRSMEVDVMLCESQRAPATEIGMEIATMPVDYTAEDAREWISNPVGQAWSRGAITCRLGHAVAFRSPDAAAVNA